MPGVAVLEQGWTGRLRAWLPTGGMLPLDAWNRRHSWILKILWAHAVVLGLASFAVGNGVLHSVFEGGLVAVCALTAMVWRADRRTSTLIAAVGLLTSSAVLVHLFDGRIEMHFSYFVMVGVVTLYQDWLPLLVVDRLRRAPARHRPASSIRRWCSTTRRASSTRGSGPRSTVGSSSP